MTDEETQGQGPGLTAPPPMRDAEGGALNADYVAAVSEAVAAGEFEVPDPYYGGDDGFEDVLDLVMRACQGLLDAEVRPRVSA